MSELPRINIIHLEDSPLDAELTAEMLATTDLNFSILRAVRLEEFQRHLQDVIHQDCISLILADYNLPGFNGMAALKVARTIDADMPFILLSGAVGEELAVELLRSGATDYVLKQNLHRLPHVVSRALDEYRGKLRERKSQEEIRKAMDEAEKANAAKSRFLGRISHELRTPLNAIIGYTQLMQADPMTEEQEHCADRIVRAGEHLLHLINEVLDITRIESGVIPITIRPVVLLTVIELAVDLVRPLARESQICVAADGGPQDHYVLADKDRLTQILVNLVTNAVKYNRKDGYVFVECQVETPGWIKILVRDTGIGIHPSKMERLFTPFDRLDLEKNSSIEGTGLGLTVTKGLVEAMNGRVGVVSSENEGSLFWIELPTAQPEEDSPKVTPEIDWSDVLPPFPDRIKVLLIEYIDAVADFKERVFRKRNVFDVTLVRSAADARTYLESNTPALVLGDLNLPDGTMEGLVESMRGEERLARVPVVVVTADACDDRKERVMNLGTQAYFYRPVRMVTLFETIHEILRTVKHDV